MFRKKTLYSDVNPSTSELLNKKIRWFVLLKVLRGHTEATALSKAVEALPPRDIETIEGRPDERAEVATKLRPETLVIWEIIMR